MIISVNKNGTVAINKDSVVDIFPRYRTYAIMTANKVTRQWKVLGILTALFVCLVIHLLPSGASKVVLLMCAIALAIVTMMSLDGVSRKYDRLHSDIVDSTAQVYRETNFAHAIDKSSDYVSLGMFSIYHCFSLRTSTDWRRIVYVMEIYFGIHRRSSKLPLYPIGSWLWKNSVGR